MPVSRVFRQGTAFSGTRMYVEYALSSHIPPLRRVDPLSSPPRIPSTQSAIPTSPRARDPTRAHPAYSTFCPSPPLARGPCAGRLGVTPIK